MPFEQNNLEITAIAQAKPLSFASFEDRGRLTRMGSISIAPALAATGEPKEQAEPNTKAQIEQQVKLVSEGLSDAAQAKVTEFASAPLQNTASLIATSAATSGLTYAAQRYLPRFMPHLKIGLLAIGAAESIPAIKQSAEAMYDTWQNPQNYAKNKDTVAQNICRPLLDLSLYAVAGVAGLYKGSQHLTRANQIASSLELQATHKPITTHYPYLHTNNTVTDFSQSKISQLRHDQRSQLSRLYQETTPSIVKIDGYSIVDNQRYYFRASGFIVDQDLIATNNHVLHKSTLKQAYATLNDGTQLPLQLVARDKPGDLALLKITSNTSGLDSLTLGSSTGLSKEVSNLYIIGHHGGVSRATASVGTLIDKAPYSMIHSAGRLQPVSAEEQFFREIKTKTTNSLQPTQAPDSPAKIIRQQQLTSNAPTRPGASGSPVFDKSGAVVGIHSRSNGTLSFHIPVENLKSLITVYRNRPNPDGWLNVLTDAQTNLPSHPNRTGQTALEILRMRSFSDY